MKLDIYEKSEQLICLTIAHNIYLTRDERYSLINGENIVVTGVSIPVWCKNDRTTSEPAEEIFCNYYLNNLDILDIKNINDGYVFNLPSIMCQKLKDINEFGSECLMFANKNILVIRNKSYYVIHYVSIQNISVLLNGLIIKR